MKEHQGKFYKSGVENQKRCDAEFHIKVPPLKKIESWSKEEKQDLKDWLKEEQRSFDLVKASIKHALD